MSCWGVKLIGFITSKLNGSQVVVLKNFVYLILLQLINYILPLLTIPYLTRVIGIGNVGQINFSSAVMVYFTVLVTFGYNYVGTKNISKNKHDIPMLNSYYTNAMIIRFVLLIIGFLFLMVISFFSEKLNNMMILLVCSFGIVVGQFLLPTWIFQGLQEMKYITILNAISKVIFTLMIFIFVSVEDEYIRVPMFMSVGSIFSGVVGLVFIHKSLKIHFSPSKYFSLIHIKEQLKDGFDVFLQQFYTTFYGPINVVLLGFICGDLYVGHYSIAEKIIGIPIMFFSLAAQAYYPYSVKLYEEKKDYFSSSYKVLFSIFFSSVILAIFFYNYSSALVNVVTGQNNTAIQGIFNILCFGLCFSSLGVFFTQMFTVLGISRTLNKVSLITMLITLSTSPFVIYQFGVVGLSYLVVIRQLFVIVICFSIIQRHKLAGVYASETHISGI